MFVHQIYTRISEIPQNLLPDLLQTCKIWKSDHTAFTSSFSAMSKS